jgi:hypothetical protein
MPAASFAALLARHSSWHAFTVFCCADTGGDRAKAPKIAEHMTKAKGIFIFQLPRATEWLN